LRLQDDAGRAWRGGRAGQDSEFFGAWFDRERRAEDKAHTASHTLTRAFSTAMVCVGFPRRAARKARRPSHLTQRLKRMQPRWRSAAGVPCMPGRTPLYNQARRLQLQMWCVSSSGTAKLRGTGYHPTQAGTIRSAAGNFAFTFADRVKMPLELLLLLLQFIAEFLPHRLGRRTVSSSSVTCFMFGLVGRRTGPVVDDLWEWGECLARYLSAGSGATSGRPRARGSLPRRARFLTGIRVGGGDR
jgi:hypothetical protein